uniref:CHCH domain-containing protein n=1 Tax=Panagrolaimus sp. PS1159 TaxID=55785 RepID=A0AC35FWS5_9BILA
MAKATEEMNMSNPPSKPARPPSTPPPPAAGHGHGGWAKNEQEEDRVEKLIRDSGCWDQHLATVECMSDKEDWRKCQEELNNFRNCMVKNRKAANK